jgi:phosphoglycerate dehydrogenase-like enzyme
VHVTAGRTVQVLNGYPFDDAARALLEGAAPAGVSIVHRPLLDQEAVDALEDDGLEVLLADFAPGDLSRTPALRALFYSGAGVDPLAPTAPWDRGLAVATASGANSLPIGEYVIAALLGVSQHWTDRASNQQRRNWQWDDSRTALIGRPLRGRLVTIVGYGSVGREVARLATAFGMRVVAVKARPERRHDDGWCLPGTGDPDGVLPERIVGFDDVETAVAPADFVVLAVPLTPATRRILGSRVLAGISPDAWLVNIARGDLFDEQELVTALRTGRLAGATLDVASEEPLPPESPLWSLPNVVVTPHVAGASLTVWASLAQLFAENLRRYVAGEPLLNLVRPDAAY